MEHRASLLILAVYLVTSCCSAPLPKLSGKSDTSVSREPTGPQTLDAFEIILRENKGIRRKLKEGDIAVDRRRSARNCPDGSCLWPKTSAGIAEVPYTLSTAYTAADIAAIMDAMQEYATLTCVRFVNQSTETNYLALQPGDGCWSHIGRSGGAQEVAMAYGCLYRGSIEHELEHALGFYHEQSRSDRDDYVTIMTQYINPGDMENFWKMDTNNLGLPYDYGSVMHYPKNAFSNTSGMSTIVPKPDPNVPIGQNIGFSNLDLAKINALYNCAMCAKRYSAPTGVLSSSYDRSISPNSNGCLYLIRLAIPYYKLFLNFGFFNLISSPDCSSAYVKIYDGPSKASPVLLDKTCGNRQIPTIISSGSDMLVEFVTDGSNGGSGFSASYTNCGSAFTTSPGVVANQYYPRDYFWDQDCAYSIMAPPGYKISLTFLDFQVEYQATCSADSLSIYNGFSTTSPLIGKYCGSNLPPHITSNTNVLLLQFHSDDYVEMRGFQATYTFVGPT